MITLAVSKILLTTANARYSHTSFGLRWLYANLGEFQKISELWEFEINKNPEEIVDKIIKKNPSVLGLGVYIWNVSFLTAIVKKVKEMKPEIIIILGGSEVWFEHEKTKITEYADYIITGEGEKAFYDLIKGLVNQEKPFPKVINGGYLDLQNLQTPYSLYSEEDISHRIVYVESSRGCPFSCEFCLSSMSNGVRKFALDSFFKDMEMLILKGVKLFKFVDRTFNLEKERVFKILDFFLENFREGMQLHFEVVPDLLKDDMLNKIKEFPKEGLHLEVGIQSLNQDVLKAISRKQNNDKALANIKYIVEHTGALVHADLVAGLPYETLQSFASGFDALFKAKPHHIQVGILKRLKGTPIIRHQKECKMVFSEKEPYEIIKNHTLEEAEIILIKRFARFYDIYCNSEKFNNSMPLVIENEESPFIAFNNFFEFVYDKRHRTHALDLFDRAELLYDYLINIKKIDKERAKTNVAGDFYCVKGRCDKLSFV